MVLKTSLSPKDQRIYTHYFLMMVTDYCAMFLFEYDKPYYICDCHWENRSYRPFKSIEKRQF